MERSLSGMCFQAVRKHFAALGSRAVLDLPVPLLTDLLPHLTVCQLDELQPGLNRRGVSTYSGWLRILQDHLGPNNVIDLHTEEEVKHAVMEQFFELAFYRLRTQYIKRNITNLSTQEFLLTAAKCIRQFVLISRFQEALWSLSVEQRPLLGLLEKNVRSVRVAEYFDPSNRKYLMTLHVLHRMLDHGAATKLVLHAQRPLALAWLLQERGTQFVSPDLRRPKESRAAAGTGGSRCGPGDDATAPPRKRLKLDGPCEAGGEPWYFIEDLQDLPELCRSFGPCDDLSDGACPRGKITCLVMRQCDSDSLKVLNSALPTFLSLHSLTLKSSSIFRECDVLELARALKQLSDSSHSSLRDLTISVLPTTRLLDILLDSIPDVTSLRAEIEAAPLPQASPPRHSAADSDVTELSLQKLSITVAEHQTDLHFFTSLLRRCPHLTRLHLAGMRLPTGSSQANLLAALSVSNRSLTTLRLEDLKLSDCLGHILHLLKDCRLEELQLKDCRLLEASPDKAESLQQLATALKNVPSLHTLSLAQNRLAKNVCVLAELFSGSSPSFVRHLDISSNFIQAAELLSFAERLRTLRPPHPLTLDLRQNPGDRDPDTWNAALETLRPFSRLVVGGWRPPDIMLDHISNM